MTLPAVTVGGPEYAERIAEVISAAFSRSLLIAYLLRKPDSAWPTDDIPADIIGPHFRNKVTTRAGLGAELVEAGDFAAVAVWFPPGISTPTEGVTDPKLLDYLDNLFPIRKKHLQGRDHWNLNLIGRHHQRTEPGVVRAVIEPYVKKAREQGVPLWLEAINDHARDVYQRFGFRTVAEVRVGVGRSNSRGELDENGEGIVVYAMMAEQSSLQTLDRVAFCVLVAGHF
ncbi:uncharacterized protein BDV14DRAFT_196347 [Aspergillus stella-maris]|uniref:uncharacterized protein n=1 Tax=Aspergillus stella-maris TaxID=1810926 RepID=UPI003CCCB7F9